jgi:uncharacterized protein YbbK (DUF523 family)
MALSRALANVLLTHPCPSCGHKLKKNGSWFKSRSKKKGFMLNGLIVPSDEA